MIQNLFRSLIADLWQADSRYEVTTHMPAATPCLVRDLMTVGVDTCSPDKPIADLARLINEKGIEAWRESPVQAFVLKRDHFRYHNQKRLK